MSLDSRRQFFFFAFFFIAACVAPLGCWRASAGSLVWGADYASRVGYSNLLTETQPEQELGATLGWEGRSTGPLAISWLIRNRLSGVSQWPGDQGDMPEPIAAAGEFEVLPTPDQRVWAVNSELELAWQPIDVACGVSADYRFEVDHPSYRSWQEYFIAQPYLRWRGLAGDLTLATYYRQAVGNRMPTTANRTQSIWQQPSWSVDFFSRFGDRQMFAKVQYLRMVNLYSDLWLDHSSSSFWMFVGLRMFNDFGLFGHAGVGSLKYTQPRIPSNFRPYSQRDTFFFSTLGTSLAWQVNLFTRLEVEFVSGHEIADVLSPSLMRWQVSVSYSNMELGERFRNILTNPLHGIQHHLVRQINQ